MLTVYTTGDGNTYGAADGVLLALLVSEYITDRTEQDVARWKKLRDKGWENMTAEERSEWMGEMKGCYGHTDMNRVESAVEVLSARLCELGYLYHPTTKTDWKRGDSPTRADFERYLGNVENIRKQMKVYSDTPEAPTIGNKLNWSRANDIEKILRDIEKLTDSIVQNMCFAGEIFAGEV